MIDVSRNGWQRKLAENLILRSFAISVLFHLLLLTVVEVGGRAGLWKHRLLPSSLLTIARQTATPVAEQQRRAEQRKEIPLLFVDVSPAQAVTDPPPEAKFYSSASTRAANPDTRLASNTPKIEGNQKKVVKTLEDARDKAEAQPKPSETKLQPQPLQPFVPPQDPPQVAQETVKPKGGLEKGDMISAKPLPKPEPANPSEDAADVTVKQETPPPRPRTMAALRQAKGITGEKVKQEGGVRRYSLEPAMDVKGTVFGAYDAAFIEAVRSRWFSLLDAREFIRNDSGKVILEFRLTKDGRITDMRVAENEVSEMLSWICQRAVQDPAPFAPFPSDLRRMLPNDYRDVRFTFHYN